MRTSTRPDRYIREPRSKKVTLLPILLPMLLAGCDNAATPSAQEPPIPQVEAMTVKAEPYSVKATLPGRIEAVRVAEVRARIAGIVLSRNFEEGSNVKAGQVLFQVDPAPFQAALSRAQGGLERADADVSDAQSVVRRYEPLVKIDAVSRQDFDNAKTTLKTALAARVSAQADVKTAKLNLDYATVRAPISGRIGRALVTEGALVGQNEATPLATIQQIDTVYADFQQPVTDALRLRDKVADGSLSQSKTNQPALTLTVDGSGKSRSGHLLFSDITVDRNTGQFLMRGEFPNPDGYLLPGMYVSIQVTQATDPHAVLIPQRAVQRAGDGSAQVMIISKEDVAEPRAVTTGSMDGARWVITQGLSEGDRVIVGGMASPGSRVAVAENHAPTTADSNGNLSTAKN